MNRPEVQKQIEKENNQYRSSQQKIKTQFLRANNISKTNAPYSFNLEMSKTASTFQNSINYQNSNKKEPLLDLERPLTRQLSKITPKRLYQKEPAFFKVPSCSKLEVTPNDFFKQSQYSGFSSTQHHRPVNVFQNTNYKNKVFTDKFFFRQNTKPDLSLDDFNKKPDQLLQSKPQKFYEKCKEFFNDENSSTQYTTDLALSYLPSLAETKTQNFQQTQNPIQINDHLLKYDDICYIKTLQNPKNYKINSSNQQLQSILVKENENNAQAQRKKASQGWNSIPSLVEKSQNNHSNSQKYNVKKIERLLLLQQKSSETVFSQLFPSNITSNNNSNNNNKSVSSRPHQRTLLFVRNEYFDICSSKNSLNFCYFQIPINVYYEREQIIKKQYREIMNFIREKLKIQNDVKVFMYLKDGTIINTHVDIPEQSKTIIISVSAFFKGIQMQVQNKDRLARILEELEKPVQIIESNYLLHTTNNNINTTQDNISQQPKEQTVSTLSSKNITTLQSKNTFEKQISKKFSPVINSIINTLNRQKIIQEDDDGNQDEDEEEKEQSEYEDFNEEYNIDSKTLENVCIKLTKQKFLSKDDQQQRYSQSEEGFKTNLSQSISQKQFQFQSEQLNNTNDQQQQQKLQSRQQINKFSEILENNLVPNQPTKFAKNWNYKGNVDYLESEEVLIKTKKIQHLQDIENFYEQELKEQKFSKIESQKEDNQIVERILNRTKITKLKTVQDNPIRKLAAEAQIFTKIKPRDQILCIDPIQDKYLKQEHKAKTKYIEVQSCEDCKTETPQTKQEENKKERKKFQITKIIANYMTQFLKELEEKKSEMKLKENDQKMLDISDSEIQQKVTTKSHKNSLSEQFENEQNNNSINKSQDKNPENNDDNNDSDNSQDQDKQLSEHSVEVEFGEEEENIGKIIKQNMMNISSKKEVIRQIDKKNPELFRLNIPQILVDIPQLAQGKEAKITQLSNLTRHDVHNIYTIYKTLHQVTSQRYDIGQYNLNDGLDYDVYRNGLYQIFMQSEELAKKIFGTIDYNFSGWMDWGEFLKLMVIIRAKTLAEKINLFIKIADENGDGTLEPDEIKKLSVVCLSRYLPIDKSDDDFVDKLCDYFTKLIFQTCQIDHEEENAQIPFDQIKKTIIEGTSQESDLLCMFCGADI